MCHTSIQFHWYRFMVERKPTTYLHVRFSLKSPTYFSHIFGKEHESGDHVISKRDKGAQKANHDWKNKFYD